MQLFRNRRVPQSAIRSALASLSRQALFESRRSISSLTTSKNTPSSSLSKSSSTPPFLSKNMSTTKSTPGKKGVHNLESKHDFDAAMNEKGSLMVLDCYATWCGPCKVIAPRVVELSDEYPNVRFYKLDVDEVPDVAQQLGIRAMPTFLTFLNGEKQGEVVGANLQSLRKAVSDGVTAVGTNAASGSTSAADVSTPKTTAADVEDDKQAPIPEGPAPGSS